MKPKKINNMHDLAMEKYRLKVSMEYTAKRLGDNTGQLKDLVSPGNLAMEAGRLLTGLVAGKPEKEGDTEASPKLETTDKKIAESKINKAGGALAKPQNQTWMMLLFPFLIGGITALMQSFLNEQEEESKT